MPLASNNATVTAASVAEGVCNQQGEAATMVSHVQTRTGPKFYVAMALLSALIALTGFSRRYLLPVAAGTFQAPAIVHIHGIITFSWVVLVIVQTLLVARGRTSVHRSLGMAGIALGTLLIFTATEVALLLLARELRDGGPSPREFSATLLSIILLIASLFSAAIANVGRPEVHKRLMLLTTFVILTPALARIIQLVDGSLTRLLRNDLAGLASDALILIPIAYDMKTRGKPHRAYVVGIIGIVLVQVATLLLRNGSAWHDATDWLAGLAAS